MSRNWIGIAENLTENGVIGSPYEQPSMSTTPNSGTAGYPDPPKNGRAITFLIVAGIVAAGTLTPPGKAIVTSIENRFLSTPTQPAQHSSAIANTTADEKNSQPTLAASPAPQHLVGEPVPKKKQVKQNEAASSNLPDSPASQRATKTQPPAAESDIDLTKYRNLTGRI